MNPRVITINVSDYNTEVKTNKIGTWYLYVTIKPWIDYVLQYPSVYEGVTYETAKRSQEAYEAYLASVERTIGGYERMTQIKLNFYS